MSLCACLKTSLPVRDAGDLVSPGMFENHLTTLNTVGVYYASGEGYIYEFAVNLETLNYLQTINLLDDAKLDSALEYMQTSRPTAFIYRCADSISTNPPLVFVFVTVVFNN